MTSISSALFSCWFLVIGVLGIPGKERRAPSEQLGGKSVRSQSGNTENTPQLLRSNVVALHIFNKKVSFFDMVISPQEKIKFLFSYVFRLYKLLTRIVNYQDGPLYLQLDISLV